jgi:hypothetical protein
MKRFLFAASLLAAAPALASGLLAPIALDSAQVMPKGVRSFRLAGFTTETGDKFDGGGQVVSLAADINKPITLKQLADAQPKGFERGQFKGGIKSLGNDLDSVVGQANGSVDSRITTTLPIFVWGVTEKFTLAVAIPIVYSNLNVSTGWTANTNMQALSDKLVSNGMGAKLVANEAQLQNVVQSKLEMLGYKPLVSETHTDMGDTMLIGKYQIGKGLRYALALTGRVVAPTGRTADPDKVIDIAGGDGQWDVGLGTAADYIFSSKVTATASVGYLYQIASTKTKRLPNSWDDSLSSDIDSSTNEKYGDIMGGSVGARWQVLPIVTLGTAYSYQYKLPDRYSGSKFESDRYGYLSKDSQQRLQAAQVSVSVSTVDLFLKKKFVAPLEVNLGFTGVLAAQNTVLANLTSLELVSYF